LLIGAPSAKTCTNYTRYDYLKLLLGQAPREDFRDFVIRHECDKGLPGLINLIGIESPGLTSSPAIAKYVASLVDEIL